MNSIIPTSAISQLPINRIRAPIGFKSRGMRKFTTSAVIPRGKKRNDVSRAENPKPIRVCKLEVFYKFQNDAHFATEGLGDSYTPARHHM